MHSCRPTTTTTTHSADMQAGDGGDAGSLWATAAAAVEIAPKNANKSFGQSLTSMSPNKIKEPLHKHTQDEDPVCNVQEAKALSHTRHVHTYCEKFQLRVLFPMDKTFLFLYIYKGVYTKCIQLVYHNIGH